MWQELGRTGVGRLGVPGPTLYGDRELPSRHPTLGDQFG